MINLRDQFGQELFRANLNIAELDGRPCTNCGTVPPIVRKKVGGKWVTDRSSRVDCDGGGKKEKLETYCKDCWRKLALEADKKIPS